MAERDLTVTSQPSTPPSVRRLGRRLRQLRLEREIANRLGFDSFGDYFADRRARGWGYARISREIGQNRDWVRSARARYEGADDG